MELRGKKKKTDSDYNQSIITPPLFTAVAQRTKSNHTHLNSTSSSQGLIPEFPKPNSSSARVYHKKI
jgi:hypothetical protein